MANILDEQFDQDEDLRLVVKKKPEMLKCNFCDWQTQKWKTTKRGKRIHAYSVLQRHVMLEHSHEWDKIQDMET